MVANQLQAIMCHECAFTIDSGHALTCIYQSLQYVCVSSPPSSPTPPHPTPLSLWLLPVILFSSLFLDNHGARNKLALVQYMFNGPEIEVISKPHGNSKGSTPYFRTSDSARQKLQTLVATQTPKTVIETVTREAGGELNIENPSDAPRNRQQISNIHRSTTGRDKNVLYFVMLYTRE